MLFLLHYLSRAINFMKISREQPGIRQTSLLFLCSTRNTRILHSVRKRERERDIAKSQSYARRPLNFNKARNKLSKLLRIELSQREQGGSPNILTWGVCTMYPFVLAKEISWNITVRENKLFRDAGMPRQCGKDRVVISTESKNDTNNKCIRILNAAN